MWLLNELLPMIQNLQSPQPVSLVKTVEQLSLKLCKIVQVLLMCLFFTLLTLLSYLFLTTLFKLEKPWISNFCWLIPGLFVQFSMHFNYTMCVLSKPGTPRDIAYGTISRISHRCRKCHLIKPARTHHCSMCNSCVLQMDHHCPWIGQCVGHHNRNYFLNFLTYTLIGLVMLRFLMDEYMSSNIYKEEIYFGEISEDLIFQTYIFVSTLILVLLGFAAFHWYLALWGKTTLEACFNDPRYQPSPSFIDNLEIVYGTRNALLMMLPCLSINPLEGFEWDNDVNFQEPEVDAENLCVSDQRVQEKGRISK